MRYYNDAPCHSIVNEVTQSRNLLFGADIKYPPLRKLVGFKNFPGGGKKSLEGLPPAGSNIPHSS
jgi:hypothetical protein